jgi:peptidoglycan hydrolase CwlO-like protein
MPKIFQSLFSNRSKNKYSRPTDIYPGYSPVLNLARRPRVRLPLRKFAKNFAVLGAVWFLILGTAVTAPGVPRAEATTAEERAQLESELKQLEGQILQYQNQIATYKKQGKSLSGAIGELNAQISKLNLQIKATNLKISELSGQISATQLKINDLSASIEKQEGNLSGLLNTLYQNESASTVEVLLRSATLTDFMGDLSDLGLVQNDLRGAIEDIKSLKAELSGKKAELTIAKADAETLANARLAQKTNVALTKEQKASLLEKTKGQESAYQAMLKDTQARANAVRARLFTILGGGQMSFGQAYEYAKFASAATGVRPAFLLAVLAHESALGKNVGQCSYLTAMNPKDHATFIEIATAVGVDPNTQKVSCPNADGIYGGAMGPAQFIPSTWKAYSARVAAITGHPANPWLNQDAFVASALYLKDAGALTSERMAAAKYYCGGNWNRYVCTNTYAGGVIDKAAKFQADIDLITGK